MNADRERLLRQITDTLIERIRPEQVVLFGSLATDRATPQSDVDLLVIMESELRRDLRQEAVSRALRPRDYPVDILAYTPAEIRACLIDPHSFINYILSSGRVLYDRQSDRVAQPGAG